MKIKIIITITLLIGTSTISFAGNKIPTKDYTIGKPTQNVKPREIREVIRPDGKRSIVTGQSRDSNGKIVGDHSHSVTKNGKVVYSRTAGGKVVKDSKE